MKRTLWVAALLCALAPGRSASCGLRPFAWFSTKYWGFAIFPMS